MTAGLLLIAVGVVILATSRRINATLAWIRDLERGTWRERFSLDFELPGTEGGLRIIRGGGYVLLFAGVFLFFAA